MELIALCVLFHERGLNGVELRGIRGDASPIVRALLRRGVSPTSGNASRWVSCTWVAQGIPSRSQIPPMIMRAPCPGIRRFDERDERNGPRRPDFSLCAVSVAVCTPLATHCENSNYRETFDELALLTEIVSIISDSLFKRSSMRQTLLVCTFIHLRKSSIFVQFAQLFHKDECVLIMLQ